MPSGASFALISGSVSILTMSALTFRMMSGGVFSGMNRPYQDEMSKPGTPDSCMVGNSGASAERLADVTARPRALPLRACCSSEPVVLTIASMRFAIRSFIAPAATPR